MKTLIAAIVVVSMFATTRELKTPCDIVRNGVAIYKPAKNFGWKADVGNVHRASVPTNACVAYYGDNGSVGSGKSFVDVKGLNGESFYFRVYWPKANGHFPSTNYPLTLTGFSN